MAENQDGQERSEQATGKRLQDARKKGQIARSRELNTTVMMIAGSAMMIVMGDHIMSGLADVVRDSFVLDRAMLFDKSAVPVRIKEAVVDGILTITPFFVVMVVAAIASSVALGGFSFSTEALGFKISKLNPGKGLKRIFGWQGLMELGKALAKFLLISSIAVSLLVSYSNEFLVLGSQATESALVHAGHLLAWSFLGFSVSLILIAAIDVPFQLWNHARNLKMTKQEVKDERKDSDGKPEVKGRIRNMQREVAMRRMMAAVPEADVVITNPTHFAVALRYDENGSGAPVVVAKGVDLVAAQIRSIAMASDVPLFPAPPLARAIYYSTELDNEIPGALYLAVAQVLAYVYQLRAARKNGTEVPLPPSDLDVPEELYKDRRGFAH